MARTIAVVLGALFLMLAMTAFVQATAPLIAGVIVVILAVTFIRIPAMLRQSQEKQTGPKVSWLDIEFPDGRKS
jgi:hypothetical protein